MRVLSIDYPLMKELRTYLIQQFTEMKQYQAGYILDAVQDRLFAFKQRNNSDPELQGLLNHLSTFDFIRPDGKSVLVESHPHPVLAVVHNIITRGTPTIPSEYVEEAFARALQITQIRPVPERSCLTYPFRVDWIDEVDSQSDSLRDALVGALHIIEPRAQSRHEFLNLADTDSNFEESFLLEMIPESARFLTQVFQHQRSRSSFTRDGNAGRVDFSLEVPYFRITKTVDKFKNPVNIKCQSCYVVEVDGKKYHNLLIDELKDFAISQLPKNVNHIKQGSAYRDVQQLINQLQTDKYVNRLGINFNHPDWLIDPTTALMLSPFLIARIQIVLLDYLIEGQRNLTLPQTIQLAVVERDLPAARLAVADLQHHLNHLNALAGNPLSLPDIELTVFATAKFADHPLHENQPVRPVGECKPDEFDLVLDVSVLRRSGIFKTDERFASDHTWLIRSSHFTHYLTGNPLLCAPCIEYLPVTREIENEVHESIEENVGHLSYFMRNIFRKDSFREGQLPIINRALQLQSVIGLLPTGGGKSLTYQLVALLQPGITVIVDPIRSLMIDQFRGLRTIGIDRCAFINSTLESAEKRYVQNTLLPRGQLQLLFVSPERFVIQEFRDALHKAALKEYYFTYVVIDEVHCVSEWGHDFRTPYLNLGQHAVRFCLTFTGRKIPLYGLTATASFDVLADIERELQIPDNDGNAVIRYENTVRDEINYGIIHVSADLQGTIASEMILKSRIGDVKQKAVLAFLDNKEQELQKFNSEETINTIIRYSWDNYVPPAYKEQKRVEWNYATEQETFDHYLAERREKLRFDGPIFNDPVQKSDKTQFSYGAVVFTPYRDGSLGVTGSGLYGRQMAIEVASETSSLLHLGTDRYGYFMGSGDDKDAGKIDEESFQNLERFIDNKFSVMVATKAFGMGIDKSNIRLTIHLNLPQSIESFVQEAGRAGRDKKLSYSLILYNEEKLPVSEPGGIVTHHIDREVLEFFHKNAFKGAVKERMTLYELRHEITFPYITNAQRIANLLTDLSGREDVAFSIKTGSTTSDKWKNSIFVNAGSDITVGNFSLVNESVNAYSDFADQPTCYGILTLVKTELDKAAIGNDPVAVAKWLREHSADTRRLVGIERLLTEMQIGQEQQLVVPFTNRYYTTPARNNDLFLLNADFKELIKTTKTYSLLLHAQPSLSETKFFTVLTEAVRGGKTYAEFIRKLIPDDEDAAKQVVDDDKPNDLHLTYYRSRSQEDTAKAIYRLICINVIEGYTVDFQNKVFVLTFKKKENGAYFDALEALMARYTSKQGAVAKIERLKIEFEQWLAQGKVTVLSFCLDQLTKFVYHEIQSKRMRAINDMIALSKQALTISDNPLRQNELIKDEIYYYFNAKYSRVGFAEPTTGNAASLVDDHEAGLNTQITLEKYIDLVNDERTGQFINNTKHLRGSTMRMLRSYGDQPAYLILKAYTLFVLAERSSPLIKEAQRDLVKGLVAWKQEQPTLNEMNWVGWLRDQIMKHITEEYVVGWFSEIEDTYYIHYYTAWTTALAMDKLQLN